MNFSQHKPMHPGTFIKRVYLEPNGIRAVELARQLKISNGLISRLLNEKGGVSSEMALKLSKVLGRSPESWLMMQDNYDLWQSKKVVDLREYSPLKIATA